MNACARTRVAWSLACLAVFVFLGGCGGSDSQGFTPPNYDAGQVLGTSAEPTDDLVQIAERVTEILGLGGLTISTEDVMRRTTGIKGDPLFVVDTREREDYAAGHIPGAINIPLQELPKELLEGTSGIPMDVDVAVASYWGGDGIFASTVINAYRITDPAKVETFKRAKSLYCGMTTWSFDRELVPTGTRFDDAYGAGVTVEEATEAGIESRTDQGAFLRFAPFGVDPVIQKILIRADRYFNSVADQRDLTMYPADLRDDLNGPQIVSVRAASAYEAGHIPGAINIPWNQVANLEEHTKYVDPGSLVAVYCYTGHSGAAGTVGLGILGYRARNVLYGMNGWSTTAPSSGQLANFDLNRSWDFPLHDWDGGLEDLDGYVPDSTGCEGCHTSLTAIWMDRELDPPTTIAPPPNSGEG